MLRGLPANRGDDDPAEAGGGSAGVNGRMFVVPKRSEYVMSASVAPALPKTLPGA